MLTGFLTWYSKLVEWHGHSLKIQLVIYNNRQQQRHFPHSMTNLTWQQIKVNIESYYSSTYILPYMQQLRLFIQWFWKYSTCLVLTFKVFRYSFSQTILMFFNRLKRDVILVRSPQNFHQWLTMSWSLSKCSFLKKTVSLWQQ